MNFEKRTDIATIARVKKTAVDLENEFIVDIVSKHGTDCGSLLGTDARGAGGTL